MGVFLSSSTTVAPIFRSGAHELGLRLAQKKYRVVYGGSNGGCMGSLAAGVLEGGGELVGVVPEMDFIENVVQEGLHEKVLVRDLRERKLHLYERSQAFIVFPGGIGTLDEVFDILSMKQIGQHDSSIVFYNYLDYWTPLLEALDTFHQQRMITSSLDQLFVVHSSLDAVLDYLNECFRN